MTAKNSIPDTIIERTTPDTIKKILEKNNSTIKKHPENKLKNTLLNELPKNLSDVIYQYIYEKTNNEEKKNQREKSNKINKKQEKFNKMNNLEKIIELIIKQNELFYSNIIDIFNLFEAREIRKQERLDALITSVLETVFKTIPQLNLNTFNQEIKKDGEPGKQN